eukprot:CAMPEP_0170485512 /NCGR_PEP_ID=MMETSP0208-20121228/4774_1 /TAXON_ID=197538 /ORGANISM="Strombidium inclinatum, Strain S3" /LENGTH=59 /DNA_ID=CAMNT_0010759199 /DNA_START=1612 /DNA_END=1791 /DNA_ORIENTATION=-
MAVYLAKLCMHDVDLAGLRPSLLAIGVIFVALKICEQFKEQTLITGVIVDKLQAVGKVE